MEIGPNLLSLILGGQFKQQMDRMEAKLDSILKLENAMIINVQNLLDAVTRETTVDDSILELVTQISAQNKTLSQELAAAIAANDPVAMKAVQDALDASVVTMTNNAQRILTAVNTIQPAA